MNYARSRNRYQPDQEKPFRLSRSKLDLFLNCPRCFYLDRRLGIGQPPGFPFNLNNAVDTLLKKEFDQYRERGIPHPLMTKNKVEAVPFRHAKLDEWRDALRGGQTYHHEPSNFLVTGGVDDLWVNGAGELIIVDYKATSKTDKISIEAPWQIGYKRQMDIYAWLYRKNNFAVADTGYFVYCNGLTSRPDFQAHLDFEIHFLPYKINDGWIEDALLQAKATLDSGDIPGFTEDCDYCGYQSALAELQSQLAWDV